MSLLGVLVYRGAVAQTVGGASPATRKAPPATQPSTQPAYAVEDITSPSVTIAPSWKGTEVVDPATTFLTIAYEKKMSAAPRRVLLGVEYGSKHNRVTSENATDLTDSKGSISVGESVAFVKFLIAAARQMKAAEATNEETVEVRIALYEIGAEADSEQKPTYGKQVSNRVVLQLKP
jgi:hypothetical protein